MPGIAFSEVAATKNLGPFRILYDSSQSRLRAVLFILDTNWTQRFSFALVPTMHGRFNGTHTGKDYHETDPSNHFLK